MKYFPAFFTVYDGEHEHSETLIIKAKNFEHATSKAMALTHDTDCYRDCRVCKGEVVDATGVINYRHPFSHCDGETSSRFNYLKAPISKKQAEWADKLLYVHIY
jgi:hypothetical protein